MSKIFDLDSPLMTFLTEVANLLIVNMLTLLCCIPIFTIGASLSAMHYMMLKIVRHEEGYIVRGFFHSFKENFKQATLEWLLFLAIFAILIFEIFMMREMPEAFPSALRIVVSAAFIVVFLIFQWLFPLQMHFVNPIKVTLHNTLLMALAKFPRTLLMALTWAIPLAVMYFGGWRTLPLVVMFGFTVPGWLMAKIYSPVFKQFEPEEAEPTPDEDFTLEGFQETQKAIHETVSASANPDITSKDEVSGSDGLPNTSAEQNTRTES